MFIQSDYKRLREEVNSKLDLLMQLEDRDEELAMSDYLKELNNIINHNSSFISIKPKIYILKKRILDYIEEDEDFESMDDSFDDNEDSDNYEGYVENFLKNKKYHLALFKDFFPLIPHSLDDDDDYSLEDCSFYEDEFLDIVEFFMREKGLFKLFDKFYSEKRVFTARRLIDNCYGLFVCRELSDDAFIFVEDFKYDLDSMITLIHELGHAYDCEHFSSNKDANNYFSYSVYTETIPRTFERLIMQFLFDRGIYSEEVKKRMLDYRIDLGHNLYFSFLYSLMDDDLLEQHFFSSLDTLVKKKLIKKTSQNDHLLRMYRKHSAMSDLDYTYGSLLSYYFHDTIMTNGFSDECFEPIFSRRNEVFSTEFMDSLGVNSDSFKRLIEKEKILLKE